jgi:hypothetical protein
MEQRRRTTISEDELLMLAEVAHLYYIGDPLAGRSGLRRSLVLVASPAGISLTRLCARFPITTESASKRPVRC